MKTLPTAQILIKNCIFDPNWKFLGLLQLSLETVSRGLSLMIKHAKSVDFFTKNGILVEFEIVASLNQFELNPVLQLGCLPGLLNRLLTLWIKLNRQFHLATFLNPV